MINITLYKYFRKLRCGQQFLQNKTGPAYRPPIDLNIGFFSKLVDKDKRMQ
jgi:hypothetical protein